MFYFSSDMKEYLRLLRDGSMRIEMSAAQLNWLRHLSIGDQRQASIRSDAKMMNLLHYAR